MDYFKELTSDTSIHEYLKDFPENDWKLVVKKTLLYGIHSLKALENLGLASPKLEKIPALHSEIAELKKTVNEVESSLTHQMIDLQERQKRAEVNKDQAKTLNKPRGTSQKQIRDRGKPAQVAVLRGSSKEIIKQPPLKFTGKEKQEVRRKLPKYLQNIDSKIKDDVLKSKKGINFSAGKGDRSERSDRDRDRDREREREKDLRAEKTFRHGEARNERYGRVERNDKSERNEINDKTDKPEKLDRKERYEKIDKNDKFDKNERIEHSERYEAAHKTKTHEKHSKHEIKEKKVQQDWSKHEKADKVEQETWEDWKNVNLSKRKSEESEGSQRSSSSFSTYHAADEVKEFYQKEFSKLMPFGGNQKW